MLYFNVILINFRGLINETDVKAELILWQRSPFEATYIEKKVETNENNVTLKLHEMPPVPKTYKISFQQNIDCLGIGNIFNPSSQEYPGSIDKRTQDNYAVGDLSSKYNFENYNWDLYLPLFGTNSIIHRSLVLYK